MSTVTTESALNAGQADELCRQKERSNPTSGPSKCNTTGTVMTDGVRPQPQAANHTVERVEEIRPDLTEYGVIGREDDKARLKRLAGIKGGCPGLSPRRDCTTSRGSNVGSAASCHRLRLADSPSHGPGRLPGASGLMRSHVHKKKPLSR